MTNDPKKTLRLLMPQWQGGHLPAYHFGAQLLAWLAPPASGPIAEVQVDLPTTGGLPLEIGIVGRSALLRQLHSAQEILNEQTPDRVVILGGDCLVDLAPFAYLNERYEGDLAVLWVDSHPDILTPEHFSHAHAMVLGNLMGEGDADFANTVKRPVKAANIMYAGLDEMSPGEQEFIERHGLRKATPSELAISSEPVLTWLKATGARNVAIHLDLDVLDPAQFRSLLFANPKAAPDAFAGIPQGKMPIADVVRLLRDVAQIADVVGLGITEHLPWDAIALKEMLAALPLLGTSNG
ncbi:arginase family protein (plasmid) [Rhizobium lusitanum]|uniref:arginase family protein n=1 Tax=Rhizobium lusitanum TaxID=293958 RepID=UPI0016071306|nr:arginase family protein [Rhizobium lusitanum]QND44417.1 arginase family protein [Rhizobium lusitanum]